MMVSLRFFRPSSPLALKNKFAALALLGDQEWVDEGPIEDNPAPAVPDVYVVQAAPAPAPAPVVLDVYVVQAALAPAPADNDDEEIIHYSPKGNDKLAQRYDRASRIQDK
ncbi:hypothetical protein Sjap_000916 [Stephania japonica]|uniref:Uncharacterized protein n=1 Tax=Stephania japonica TaxID=461633 RepID=A0AAP0KJ04_9MAGN